MKLAIVGTGLMGAAVARAVRQRAIAERIVGIEPSAEHAEQALASGVVDAIVDVGADAAASELAEVDLVVLACPSHLIPQWVEQLQAHSGVVIDVGSVKLPIITEVRQRLGELPVRFIPCHPVAGSEKVGPEHAPADLFNNRRVVITPESNADAQALQMARRFWQDLGAEVVEMDAASHDARLAVTSHLPHFLAYAFMQQIDDDHLSLSGGGFSDFTRVAASNPDMWWRIFKLNRDELLAALDRFEGDLADLRGLLEREDDAIASQRLASASSQRGKLQ